MVMEHSATAQMMDLYDSSMNVNSDSCMSSAILHDMSCTVNFSMYVALIIDVTPAL
jgi:23S rRNA maturation-related 3'-5' exoribonuclease YhaM